MCVCMWIYRILRLTSFHCSLSAPSCSLEHGHSQNDSPRCDCPTWSWVTSQEATMLGKPGPSCGCCKSSVGTCPWLGFRPDGGVDSAQGCGVCPLSPHQDAGADALGDHKGVTESWRHTQSPGWTLMLGHGWLEVFLSSTSGESRAGQDHSVLSKPSPAYSSGTTQPLGSIGE